MTAHSLLGPSGRHRWTRCPGSVRMCKDIKRESTVHSIEGTHAHHLLKDSLVKNESPLVKVGTELTDEDGVFIVTQEMAERVEIAYQYVVSRQVGTYKAAFIETRFKVENFAGREDLWGTIDVVLAMGDSIEIIEYKDGMNPVNVVDNPQLEMYALAVLSTKGLQWVKTARMTVIQPRLAIRGGEVISSIDLPIEDIASADRYAKLLREAAATDDPKAPLVPGQAQCKYCAAKATCPALLEYSTAIVPREDEHEVAHLSVDRLTEVLERAPLVRQFIEAVEEEATKRLMNGHPVPGYKLVNGRGSKSWKLTDEAMTKRLVKMGVPKKLLTTSKFISPPKVKTLVWETKEGTPGKLSPRQLQMVDKEYIEFTKGGFLLAPDSDSREGVNTSVTHLFEPVPDLVVEVLGQFPLEVEPPTWLN